MSDKLTLTSLMSVLKSKEGQANPFLLFIMGYISDALLLAEETTGEKAQYFITVACRTALEFQPLIRKSVNASPTPYDDKITDEFFEFADRICPGYVPVPCPPALLS